MILSRHNLNSFILIQSIFSLFIVALMFGERFLGYDVSLIENVKPNPESFYLLVITIGMFLGRCQQQPFLVVRLQHRSRIFWHDFFNILVYALATSLIYWMIIGITVSNCTLPSLLIDAFLFALNGCLIGTVLFTLVYAFPNGSILPLLICLVLIIVVCFARVFASPYMNNGYNLFIAQSWFKGGFGSKTVGCLLLIFAFNYFNSELARKIEVY
ncbi:hypothetical protein [Lacticaseibacillus paracasei]|uniref:hypothetical protein n=1 Tax=Lacticaseibacillus paracasei TaxID=1597 RepID=UPI0021D1A4F4|nr:hypothetical protein [Lacticaseibacillus paracasei]MCU6430816.1 hypothetical protein [Lacticaseibacillus paracasei]